MMFNSLLYLTFRNSFLDLLDLDLAEAFDFEQGLASSTMNRLVANQHAN